MEVPRFTRPALNPRLAEAWLDADGDLDVIAEAIEDWLGHENNRLLPEAWVVYELWLDARGKPQVVAEALNDWLGHENNRLLPEAEVVYRAWLQARGKFAIIRKPVLEWIRTHTLERSAVFLLKYVVKQRVLPDDVTAKILEWCAEFAHDPDAIWRLNSLSAHISSDLFIEAVRASASVLEPIFANVTLSGVTRSQVTTVLGNLVKLEHLGSHESRELDALLCRWMNHPQSFEPEPAHAPHHQTRQILARFLSAAEREPITPDLSPLIAWTERWDDTSRKNFKDLTKRLRALRRKSTSGGPRSR